MEKRAPNSLCGRRKWLTGRKTPNYLLTYPQHYVKLSSGLSRHVYREECCAGSSGVFNGSTAEQENFEFSRGAQNSQWPKKVETLLRQGAHRCNMHNLAKFVVSVNTQLITYNTYLFSGLITDNHWKMHCMLILEHTIIRFSSEKF